MTNNGKDRSLCANLSAAQTFTVDHLEVPENKAIIENAQFYLVTVNFFCHLFYLLLTNYLNILINTFSYKRKIILCER